MSKKSLDIRAIQRALGDLAVVYYGDVSNDAREQAVTQFQENPNIKYRSLSDPVHSQK